MAAVKGSRGCRLRAFSLELIAILNELSRIAGMSPKYFCSYFHSIIHRTPIDYLNYYRIERACSELSTSDLTLTEVAYRCGFSDVCYFIKTFKRYKGITPRRYRLNIG